MEGGCNKESRICPYCDAEVAEASFPYCEACRVTIISCPKCSKPVSRDAKVCPSCGTKMNSRAQRS